MPITTPRASRAERRDHDRAVRRQVERERIALRTGEWGPWEHGPTPGRPGPNGWLADVHTVRKNRAFAVLERTVETEWGPVEHLIVNTLSGADVPWAAKQRIKNELAGPERTAVEVFPPDAELVDEAPAYHLWVLPAGFTLPFTLAYGAARRGSRVPQPGALRP
jgi:hypothetical protein